MNFYQGMKHLWMMTAAALCLSAFPLLAQNQGPQTPEQREKQLLEFIDKEVKRLSEQLELEYWQEFYVDSTLTHDYHAMQEELEDFQQAKVSNVDLYQAVQDKWMEQIDRSYQRFFTEDQWKKYWKSTGQRAQKARDKRKAKSEKASAGVKNEGK
jgi:ATP-dependent Lon protease